jgi:hypothetical protein
MKNGYVTKSNLHVYAIPIKIPVTFVTEIEKMNLKVHLEAQKTTNSQGNTEQKEQYWRYHNT